MSQISEGPLPSQIPPGPRLPGWVQTLAFARAPERFAAAARRRHGDVVSFRQRGGPPAVVIFDPEVAAQALRDSSASLRAGEARTERLGLLGRQSVLLLDGSAHARHRRLLLPLFHRQRVRRYEEVVRGAADRAIDSWPVAEPFALMPSMLSLTLDAIVRAVLGDRDDLVERLRRHLPGAVGLSAPGGGGVRARLGVLRRRPPWVLRPLGAAGGRRVLDELIDEEIELRRRAPDLDRREDLLSMLMLARDEDGEPLSDGELRDDVSTLLEAGHHTTGIALAWTFDLLLRHPPVFERLRARLSEGDEEYLNAVLKETLRVRPVVTHVQRLVGEEPFTLGQHVLPPGALLRVSIRDIHRRGDRFHQPDAFRPERFFGADPPDANAWLPFGGGPRRCLGASFATFEIGIVLRRVLERTCLEPLGRRAARAEPMGNVLVPKNGVRVVQPRPPHSSGST